tara:strand:- start:4418 stop:5287 length:870 start_codon:yes stop_codon:yes gene_type:complete
LIYLICSVLASTLIFIAFKLFAKFRVDTFQAIVVNYLFACISGIVAFKGDVVPGKIIQQPWIYGCLGLGVLFIIIFNLMALTTQRSGISVVSVATKMSVVIPIAFGIFYYSEDLGISKGVGIVLALIAVYLASIKESDGLRIEPKNLIFPVLVFLGSGVIDLSIKYLEDSYVTESDIPIFSATIFATAFVVGVCVLLFQVVQGKFRFQLKNLLGGIGLGIPNYFSIYFLVKALRANGLDSSTVFTINNVAIVMVSTLVGIALFGESLSKKNWAGIVLAVLSIILVTLSF